ncbi:MAG: transposase [Saprospiraceae bacterium]|nr:transposase [Saprospiraceae bacterium]
MHFLTITVVGWVKIFDDHRCKKIITDSLKYCQQHKGLRIHAYVIMSNHIHLICRTIPPFKLSDTIRDFKKFCAKAILKLILEDTSFHQRDDILEIFEIFGFSNSNNKRFQVWYQRNRPIELFNPVWIKQKLNYIHHNPVKAGMVAYAEEYAWSSAAQYKGQQDGCIDIDRIEI